MRAKVVASLKAGQFLGEKSFMFNSKRTTNIVCTEDSCFALLTEEDYKEILMPVDESRISEVIDFIKQFKLFRDYEKVKLYDLNYYFRKTTLTRDDFLCKQGDTGEHFFIVIKGEFHKLVKMYIPREKSKIENP